MAYFNRHVAGQWRVSLRIFAGKCRTLVFLPELAEALGVFSRSFGTAEVAGLAKRESQAVRS